MESLVLLSVEDHLYQRKQIAFVQNVPEVTLTSALGGPGLTALARVSGLLGKHCCYTQHYTLNFDLNMERMF